MKYWLFKNFRKPLLKVSARLFIFIFLILTNNFLHSQTILKVGASQTYTRINSAYTAIPSTITGPYVIEIQNDYNPAGESYPISFTSKTGASETNYIKLTVAAGVTKTFSVNEDLLIDFNGADYFIIDGLDASSLAFICTSSTGVAIQFRNNATHNTVMNCTIKGRNTSAASGVIYFNTSSSSTGNSNNLITQNKVSSDGINIPANLIYSNGTSTRPNSNNTISKNEIFNFGSYGIYITSTGNGNNWIIGGTNPGDGNHFYCAYTRTSAQTAVYLKTGSSSSGNIVSYNYVGGQTTYCGGSAWQNSGNVNVTGIKVSVSTTVNGADVKHNTIQNFYLTGSGSSATFFGIYADSGMIVIDSNFIGDRTTSNSITSTAPALIAGIYSEVLFPSTISNNEVANMYQDNNGSSTTMLRGIFHNNRIGSASGNIEISGNTIHDLTSKGTINFANGTVFGIGYSDTSTTSDADICYNTIYNLYCTSTTGSSVYDAGIACDQYLYKTNIYGNRIYNVKNDNLTDAMIGGILTNVDLGTAAPHTINIYNNMVALDDSRNTQMFGIWDAGTVTSGVSMNIYYNSVILTGTISSGNNESSCYSRGFTGALVPYMATTSITKLRNNIFINQRTGGTGRHFAVLNAPSTNPATGWSNDYSNYNFLSANSSTIGGWGQNTINSYTIDTWRSFRNQDPNSWSVSSLTAGNLFQDISTADLNVKINNQEVWYVNGKGIAGVNSGSIGIDFYRNSRTTQYGMGTDIGAVEFNAWCTPMLPSVSGTIGIGNTQTFTFASRTLGSIQWVSGSSLPSSINFEYNSGSDPPGTLTGNYGNCYWNITQLNGTNYNYTVTLNYDPALTGTITAENNIRLGKTEGSIWIHYAGSTVNTTNKTVACSGLTTFSFFALSDNTSPLPVTISYFNSIVNNRKVKLMWGTTSEINNKGFDIERSIVSSNNWQKVGFVNGYGNSYEPKDYSYTDEKLSAGKFNYRLKQTDYNGNFEYYDLHNEVSIETPQKFDLYQNYPNPSNPVSRIDYQIPSAGKVELKIYDLTGREVAFLVNSEQDAGYYTIIFDGSNYASGIYIYRLTANGFSKTMKLVVVK